MKNRTQGDVKLMRYLNRLSDFSLFVIRRLYRDHCGQIAASLTFNSLLAMVPFFIVSFSIISEFPIFPRLVENLQHTLLQVLTPDVGLEVKSYLQNIISKGKSLPVLSLVILFFTVVMMLYTIDDRLNRMWQVEYRRRTWFSLLIYFIVLLSGPILLGASLALTTYLFSQSILEAGTSGLNWLSSIPWLFTFIAFTLIYRWVPNTFVEWRYAISGGVVAMLLFELAKWGFALYIQWVPTYNLLYGALAAIPLSLVWIYLSWFVVLVGAETARCLATYRYGDEEADLTARQLLGFFHRTRTGAATRDQIAAWGYLGKQRVDQVLSSLLSAGFIERSATDKYKLTDKSRKTGLEQLRQDLKKLLKSIGN